MTSLWTPHRGPGAFLLSSPSSIHVAAGTADAADQQDQPHVTIGEAGDGIQSVP